MAIPTRDNLTPQTLWQDISDQLKEYDTAREYIPELDATRVSVQGRYFDLRYGPMTEFGPSFEVLGRGTTNLVVGPSIVGQTTGRGADKQTSLEFRSPLKTLVQGIVQSVRSDQSLWSTLTLGQQSKDLSKYSPGGSLQHGPNDTEPARADFASRITIGATPGTFLGDVTSEIENRRLLSMDQGSKWFGSVWERLDPFFMHKDDDNMARLRRMPGSIMNTKTGRYEEYESQRGAAGKDIKGLNITHQMRQTAIPYALQRQDEFRGRQMVQGVPSLRPMTPGQVQQSRRAEYAVSNVILPGEGKPRSGVFLNEAIGVLPFSPGQGMHYGDIFDDDAHSFRVSKDPRISLPFKTFREFQSAQFEFDKSAKGRTILAGTSHQVGSYSYIPEGSKERSRSFPLTVSAGASDLYLEKFSLSIPRSYDPDTGNTFGLTGEAGTRSTQAWLNEPVTVGDAEYASRDVMYRRQGIDVNRLAATGYHVVMQGAQSVAGGFKSFGTKESLRPNVDLPEGYTGRDVTVGGQPIRIDVHNPEVKSNPARMLGALGGLVHENQKALIGMRFPGLAENIDKHRDKATGAVDWDLLSAEAGMTAEGMASELYEHVSDKNMSPEQRKTIAKRFGMGWTDKPVWVGEYVNDATANEQARLIQDYFGEKGVDPSQYFRSTPGTGKNKGRQFVEYYTRPFIMRTFNQATPEYAGEATLNYEMMTAIQSNFAETAKLLGIHGSQGPGTDQSPARKAMREMGRSFAYNMSGETLAGANVVDHKKASQMLTELERIPEGVVGEARMEELQKVLGNETMFFKTMQTHMFSPGAAAGAESFEMDKSVTGMSIIYEGAVKQLLSAEVQGDPISGWASVSDQSSPFSKMSRRLKRMFPNTKLGKNARASLYGRTSAGATSGRYSNLKGLAPMEVYMGDDQIRRMLKDMKVSGDDMDAAIGKINEHGYMPSFTLRQPVLSSKYGAPVVKVLTSELMKKKGMVLPDAAIGRGQGNPLMGNVSAWMNETIYNMQIGDLDFDPNAMVPAAKWDKEAQDFIWSEDVDPEIVKALNRTDDQVVQESLEGLEAQVGKGKLEYNTLRGTVEDYYENVVQGKVKGESITRRSLEEVREAGKEAALNKGGMGVAYSVRRRITAAAGAMGTFKQSEITKATDKQAKLYQQYLDSTRDSLTRLGVLHNSIAIQPDPGNGYHFSYLTQPTGDKWGGDVTRNAKSTNALRGSVVAALAEDYMDKRAPIPAESLAFMLSSGGKETDRILKTIRANEDDDWRKLSRALAEEMGGTEGEIKLENTPIGISLMSSAVTRSMGKTVVTKGHPDEGMSVADALKGTSIAWEGTYVDPSTGEEKPKNTWSLEELALEKKVRGAYVGYRGMSGHGVPLPQDVRTYQMLAKYDEGFQRLANQFSDWNASESGSIERGVDEALSGEMLSLASRSVRVSASSLEKLASGNVKNIFSPTVMTNFNDMAVIQNALRHIDPDGLYGVLKQTGKQVEKDLGRGAPAESALMGTRAGRELGKHIGSSKHKLTVPFTTASGKFGTLIGIPDIVKIGEEGIEIGDVKSSGKGLDYLRNNKDYQTQLQTYAGMFHALATQGEGERLKEILGEWNFTQEEQNRAVDLARQKKISGSLHALPAYKEQDKDSHELPKGFDPERATDVTPDDIRSGAYKAKRLEMGNMFPEDLGQKLTKAVENTIAAMSPSLSYLQQLISMGGEVKYGSGTMQVQGNFGFVNDRVNLSQKILSGRWQDEDPRLTMMKRQHSTDIFGGGLSFEHNPGGSNLPDGTFNKDKEELEAVGESAKVEIKAGDKVRVTKMNDMKEKMDQLNQGADVQNIINNIEQTTNQLQIARKATATGVTITNTGDEGPEGDDKPRATTKGVSPATATLNMSLALNAIEAAEKGNAGTYIPRLKKALIAGTGMEDASVDEMIQKVIEIQESGTRGQQRNVVENIGPMMDETRGLEKMHKLAVTADNTSYRAEQAATHGYVIDDYLGQRSPVSQAGSTAAVLGGGLTNVGNKMEALTIKSIEATEKMTEMLGEATGGMKGLAESMDATKESYDEVIKSGDEPTVQGRRLQIKKQEQRLAATGRTLNAQVRAAAIAEQTYGPDTEEFAEAYNRADATAEKFHQQRAGLDILQNKPIPVEDDSILGKLKLRRIFGGFGMMYMQRLGQLATGGLGYGMEERTAMDSTYKGVSAGLTGVGSASSNQMQILQNQMALSGTNNNPMMQLQSLRSTMPGGNDMFTGISAGVGMYAFGQQMAMWGSDSSMFGKIFSDQGMPMSIRGKQIGTLRSGHLMAAAAGVSLLLGGYSAGQDPVGIGSRLGSGNYSNVIQDTIGMTMNPGRWGEYEEYAQSSRTIRNALESGASFDSVMDDPVQRKLFGIVPMASRQVDTSTPGGKTWKLDETMRQLTSLNPEFSPEVIGQTFGFMQTHMTGSNNDQFGAIAAQFNAGYNQNVASAVLSAGGMSMGQQFTRGQGGMTGLGAGYNQLIGQVTQANQPVLQAGLSTAQQMGYAYQNNVRGMDISQQADYLMGLGDISPGTLGGDLTISSEQTAFRGQQQGYNAQARKFANNILPSYGYDIALAEAREKEGYTRESNIDLMLTNRGYTPDQRRARTSKYKAMSESDRLLEMTRDERQYAMVGQLEQFGLQSGMTAGQARSYSEKYMDAGFYDTQQEISMQSQKAGLISGGMEFGMTSGVAQAFAGGAMAQGPQGMRFAQNLMSFNPIAIAQASQGGASMWNNVTTRQLRQTYDAGGNALGIGSFGLGTMDLGYGGFSSSQAATNIFGADWQQNDPFGLRSSMVEGGFRQVQTDYRHKMAGLSAAGAGIAMRGAELSYAFQTGIGIGDYGTVNPVTGNQFNLPSGGVWGVQDQQRGLQHRQQMWNFQYQEMSMDMQRSQFEDNQGLQRRGMDMNRGFARRGWEFQDQITDLQWGWQQEDYGNEKRFTTGRARKKMETQMDRATIMHELQSERTDEQRSQQEELWQLEDERFNNTREHFEEQMELQEANFQKMQEFYEERKKLEDQMQELQRAMFIEQNKLQMESAGIQAAQAALAAQMADDMEKAQQFYEDQQARADYTRTTWDGVLEMFVQAAEKIAEILDLDLGGSNPYDDANDDGGYNVPDPEEYGEDPYEYASGTQGYRRVPGLSGQPFKVTLHGGEMFDVRRRDEVSNPWNDEVMPNNVNVSNGASVSNMVVVKIGENEIRDYIVETVQMEM